MFIKKKIIIKVSSLELSVGTVNHYNSDLSSIGLKLFVWPNMVTREDV